MRNGSGYGTVPVLIINICRRLSSELETVGTAARDFEEQLRLRYCTVLIITICRRLSSELETVGTAARDFEERLRFQLETSLRTEEENEANSGTVVR